MKLLSFQRRDEGSELPRAMLSFWTVHADYGAGQVLRSFGASLMLPTPVRATYFEPWSCTYKRGKRCPTVGIRFSLVRGQWRRLRVGALAWMRPDGPQEIVATREQIEDGIYPPKEGAN